MIFILGALMAVGAIVILVLCLLGLGGMGTIGAAYSVVIILAIGECVLILCFFIKLYRMAKEIKTLRKQVDVLMRKQGTWWLQ